MRMFDIIKKKRDGGELTNKEIAWFIDGYVKGEIPDYQAAALCMAIYYKGMTIDETTALTFAIRDSGDTLDFSKYDNFLTEFHAHPSLQLISSKYAIFEIESSLQPSSSSIRYIFSVLVCVLPSLVVTVHFTSNFTFSPSEVMTLIEL